MNELKKENVKIPPPSKNLTTATPKNSKNNAKMNAFAENEKITETEVQAPQQQQTPVRENTSGTGSQENNATAAADSPASSTFERIEKFVKIFKNQVHKKKNMTERIAYIKIIETFLEYLIFHDNVGPTIKLDNYIQNVMRNAEGSYSTEKNPEELKSMATDLLNLHAPLNAGDAQERALVGYEEYLINKGFWKKIGVDRFSHKKIFELPEKWEYMKRWPIGKSQATKHPLVDGKGRNSPSGGPLLERFGLVYVSNNVDKKKSPANDWMVTWLRNGLSDVIDAYLDDCFLIYSLFQEDKSTWAHMWGFPSKSEKDTIIDQEITLLQEKLQEKKIENNENKLSKQKQIRMLKDRKESTSKKNSYTLLGLRRHSFIKEMMEGKHGSSLKQKMNKMDLLCIKDTTANPTITRSMIRQMIISILRIGGMKAIYSMGWIERMTIPIWFVRVGKTKEKTKPNIFNTFNSPNQAKKMADSDYEGITSWYKFPLPFSSTVQEKPWNNILKGKDREAALEEVKQRKWNQVIDTVDKFLTDYSKWWDREKRTEKNRYGFLMNSMLNYYVRNRGDLVANDRNTDGAKIIDAILCSQTPPICSEGSGRVCQEKCNSYPKIKIEDVSLAGAALASLQGRVYPRSDGRVLLGDDKDSMEFMRNVILQQMWYDMENVPGLFPAKSLSEYCNKQLFKNICKNSLSGNTGIKEQAGCTMM